MNYEQSPLLAILNYRFATRSMMRACEQRVSLLDKPDQLELLAESNEQLTQGGVLLLDSHQRVPWPDRPIAMTDIIASMYSFLTNVPNVKRIAVPVAGIFYHLPVLNQVVLSKLDGSEAAPIKTMPVYSSRRELKPNSFWGMVFALSNGFNLEKFKARNQTFHTMVREELKIPGTLIVMSVFGGLQEIGKGELPRKMHETMTSVNNPIITSHSHLQKGRFTSAFEQFTFDDDRSIPHVQLQVNQSYVRMHQRILDYR